RRECQEFRRPACGQPGERFARAALGQQDEVVVERMFKSATQRCLAPSQPLSRAWMALGSSRTQIFSVSGKALPEADRFGLSHQDLVNHFGHSTTSCGFALAPTTKSANLPLAIQFWEVGMELGQNQVEALDLWRRVTVTTVRSDAPDLTARQLAVLMT